MMRAKINLSGWGAIGVAVLTSLSATSACGGDTGYVTGGGGSSRDAASSGGANNISSGGGSSNGTGASSGSGGSKSGSGGQGGYEPSNPDCNLPPNEVGDCDGAILRYSYHIDSGLCLPFSYGRCGGNANNFETREACDDACRDGEPTPINNCSTHEECRLVETACCGACEPATLDDFTAANYQFEFELVSKQEACAFNAFCERCDPGPPSSQNFGVLCEEGTCLALDVREHDDLSSCSDDDDCRLRAGIDCCERCADDAWVALSVEEDDFLSESCNETPTCPACVVPEPVSVHATCVAGMCAVVSN